MIKRILACLIIAAVFGAVGACAVALLLMAPRPVLIVVGIGLIVPPALCWALDQVGL